MNILLVVVSSTTPSADDIFLHDRLVAQGHTVTYESQGDASYNLAGKNLVLISAGTNSGASGVSTKLDSTSVGVMTVTGAGRPHSSLAAPSGSSQTVQTWLAIAAAGSPLLAGLTGTQTVLTAAPGSQWLYWNVVNLGTGATISWSYGNGNSTRAVVLRCSAGGQLAVSGPTMPSRRVALSLSNTPLSNLNANGLAILDAAVTWAAAPTPTANAGSDRAVQAAGIPTSTTHDVALAGSATDPDGLSLTYAWRIVSDTSGTASLLTATSQNATLRVDKYGATVVVGLIATNTSGTTSPESLVTITVNPVAYWQTCVSGVLVKRQLFTAVGGSLV